jgi:hypothetical protein
MGRGLGRDRILSRGVDPPQMGLRSFPSQPLHSGHLHFPGLDILASTEMLLPDESSTHGRDRLYLHSASIAHNPEYVSRSCNPRRPGGRCREGAPQEPAALPPGISGDFSSLP